MAKRIILVFLVLLTVGGINYYLFEEKLFFYSTGIDTPAFANSTWLMSEKEVERANKQKVILSIHDRRNLNEKTLHVLNVVETADIMFNDIEFSIKYVFYKDRLIRYELFKKNIELQNLYKMDSSMVSYLKMRFGDNHLGELKTPYTFCIWDTCGVIVEYISSEQIGRALTISGQCKIVSECVAHLLVTYKPYSDTLRILQQN